MESVRTQAANLAGQLDAQAAETADRADITRGEAQMLRTKAAELRNGRLLPLPRPDWAGPGDDEIALGSALDWRSDVTDPYAQALLESAMAASGLLGATLDDGSATTAAWTVGTRDIALAHDNLAQVLTVDSGHPRAATVAAVLERIRYVSTAAETDDAAALVIGADGTFRAGVLLGRAPGAVGDAQPPPASHIGARQRRAAALREAERLDAEANELESAAEGLDAEARQLSEQATDIRYRAASFPKIEPLRKAEAERARLAANARDAARAAETAETLARDLRAEHRIAADEWAQRTRARQLPVDLGALRRLRDDGVQKARVLDDKAQELTTKHTRRVSSLLADVRTDDSKATELEGLAAAAKTAHERATAEEAKLEHLRQLVGSSAAQAVQEHKIAVTAETAAIKLLEHANTLAKRRGEAKTKAATAHELAVDRESKATPAAALAVQKLRLVLDVDGVGGYLGIDLPGITDQELPGVVRLALAGRRTNARKTVRERYDLARATLAGIWVLEPGDSHGELDTYVLTHKDQTYTPHAAAKYARTLKERAEAALAAAEEAALRDFVIGRLPSAIGVAWQRLQDWNKLVNRKMRTASASSGVGVQVRIHLLKDLSKAVETVHELSCKMSEAGRGPEEQQRVGQALQALITAAAGETMEEKVAAAVDIREWVSVHYEVNRPGHQPTKWGRQTGLSTGERRLVVLAPMLAAIAAAYDRAEPDGLRLAALDEVPTEVDEEGRTALARYLAELDLDLLCTSHSWDGAPGAWDGIDAYDLEKDTDDTVVAFPMLVRGLVEDIDGA
jgi:hypothetical protein